MSLYIGVGISASSMNQGLSSGTPPTNIVAPLITGTPKKGEVLTGNHGTWTGSPTFTQQWRRNGVVIPGATALTYTPVEADVTTVLTFHVNATNAGGTIGVTSAGTANVFSSTTTGDGYEVHWITVADSIYNGTGTADITIAAGILYLWNGSSLTEITNQNICNGVTSGSPWKVYAVEYVANHPGRKVVLVQNAKGGANLGPDGVDTDNWGPDGALRGPSDVAVDAALAFLELDYPISINCDAMINDVRVPQTIETITAYFDECISHLTTKFPDSPILYSIPGRNGTTSNTLLLKQARNLILQRCRTVSNLYVAAQTCSFESIAYYQGDALHPIKAGSEQLGISNARWHSNSSYSKYARAIVSTQFATLDTDQKDLIAAEIDAIGDAIYGYECYFPAVVADDRDRYHDWAFLTSPVNAASTSTLNQYCTSNGTTYMRTAYVPSTLSIRVSQNDLCIGVYIKTMRSDASTLRVAFGASDTSKQMVIGQTTTGVFYRIGDNTLTVYAAEAKLQDNSEYVAIRDSATSKALNKNGVEVHRATVNSLALVTQSPTVGLLNQNGSPASGVDMDYQNLFISTSSAYNTNRAATFAARKNRIDNWNA